MHSKGEIKVTGYHGHLTLEDSKGTDMFMTNDISDSGYANAERITALWNAAPDNTDKAVAYLEYGAEMETTLKAIELDVRRGLPIDYDSLVETLTKLGGE